MTGSPRESVTRRRRRKPLGSPAFAAVMRWWVLILLAASGCVGPLAQVVHDGMPGDGRAAADPAGGGGPLVLQGAGDHAMEPHVAVWGDNIIVANMNEVPNAGPETPFTVDLDLHRSHDGGATWHSGAVPVSILVQEDPTGTYNTLGDPVLAYAPDGTLYLAGVAARFVFPTTPMGWGLGGLADLSVFVTRSGDHGQTWGPAVAWHQGVGPVPGGVMQDKPWITVDPEGTLHLAWTRFLSTAMTLEYSRLEPAGAWTEPVSLATAIPGDAVKGATLAAPGGGLLYLSYSEFSGSGGRQAVRVSEDGGASWGPAIGVAPARSTWFGAIAADPADPLRAVVVVPDQDLQVRFAATRDGGAGWSLAEPVAPSAGDQLLPAVWFGPDGLARVGYQDLGWPGGERFVLATLHDAGTTVEPAGSVVDPGPYRREYLGLDGEQAAWAAWIGGTTTQSWVEVQRFE